MAFISLNILFEEYVMKRTIFFFLALGIIVLGLISCDKSEKKEELTEEKINLDITVGELARFAPVIPVPVRGYGIVAGLWGTGSSECPPELRPQLEKDIWHRIPNAKSGEINRFITDMDTAVVEIIGVVPPMAATQERFDIEVKPLAKTQTTSLRGGSLYTVELKELSRMSSLDQYTKSIGSAEGQIFTYQNETTKETNYYIFGGGTAFLNSTISMVLNQSNYLTAMIIRNRLNERFGSNTASAVSPQEIQVSIPTRYLRQKLRFLSMIQLLYLSEDDTLRKRRIEMLSSQLAEPQKAAAAEIALEAIGRPAIRHLSELLNHPEVNVRFFAARCMMNIGDNRGLQVIRDVAFDPKSQYRIAAIESLSRAKLKDAEPILSKLLAEDNLDVRLSAYEQLISLNSILVKRIPVGENFFVDLISCSGPKIIYAYRKDNARIAIFGYPVTCRKNLFLDMDQVLINSQPEHKYISVSRRHPVRAKLIGPLKCGYSVEDVIRTLGYSPETDAKYLWTGLGISYSEILTIVETMCRENMIPATFVAGPVTNINQFIEETTPEADNKEENNKKSL
jgi:hypothetical protein